MRLTGALATHYHADHVGGRLMGHSDRRASPSCSTLTPVPIHVQADEAQWVHAGHRRDRLRPGRPRQRRHGDGRRDPDHADPHARAHPGQPVLPGRRAGWSPATRSSSTAAAAPTSRAATRRRSTRASPRGWPRCPTTRCCTRATSTRQKPSASMAETRSRNVRVPARSARPVADDVRELTPERLSRRARPQPVRLHRLRPRGTGRR